MILLAQTIAAQRQAGITTLRWFGIGAFLISMIVLAVCLTVEEHRQSGVRRRNRARRAR